MKNFTFLFFEIFSFPNHEINWKFHLRLHSGKFELNLCLSKVPFKAVTLPEVKLQIHFIYLLLSDKNPLHDPHIIIIIDLK